MFPIMFKKLLCLLVPLVNRVIVLFVWDITEVAHKDTNATIAIVVSLLRPRFAR